MELSKEKELIEQTKKDSKKFEKIYREYVKDVFRYSLSIVYNQDKAEDITQEAFTKALENINKFQWKGLSIKAWLFTIARNTAYDRFAKKKEMPLGDRIKDAKDTEYTDKNVDPKLQSDISEALRKLPTVTREIVILKIWEEYKFIEIADIVDKTEGAVKMQFYRGIERLKELLEEKGYDKSYVVLPVLFKGILQNKHSKLYQCPAELASNLESKLFNSSSKLTNLSTAQKMKIPKPMVYVSAGIIVIGIIAASGYGIWKYFGKDQNDEEEPRCISCEDEDELQDEKEDVQDNEEDEIEVQLQIEDEIEYEIKTFTIDPNPTYQTNGLEFTGNIPIGTEFNQPDPNSNSPSLSLFTKDYQLEITLFYESWPVSFGSLDVAFTRSDWGTIYRYEYEEDGVKNYRYVNYPSFDEICNPAYTDPEDFTIQPPCGLFAIASFDYNSEESEHIEDSQKYWFSPTCTGDRNICETILESLSVKKLYN